ncbi:hypothetical protein [Coleofasciculus sp. B1-GNL1-01]|uniref:hypothetical protein n=1 Tax=Coleofasciculus sp. B1-GNL1-01 TaxID=3068484 RepID=UPI004063DD68
MIITIVTPSNPSICAKAFGAAQTAQVPPNTTGFTITVFHHVFAIVTPHTLFSSKVLPDHLAVQPHHPNECS